MDSDDAVIADMMKRAHLTRWVTADDSDCDDLLSAVHAAGLIGETF